MKMRQHKILTWTLLILSIINFALAAPAAVRERPKVRLDANVTRNVTAASQKRWDPVDNSDFGGSPNIPGPDYATPPSPDLADILFQIPHADMLPPTPDSPGHLAGSGPTNLPRPNHALPPNLDSTDLSGQHGYTDSPWRPWPKFSPLPPRLDPMPWSELTRLLGIAAQAGYHTDSLGSLTGPGGVLPSPGSPAGSRLPMGSTRISVAGSISLPPTSHHSSQPGPSEGSSASLYTLSSTGHQPTPPGVDPETHLGPFPTELWDELFKHIPTELRDHFLKGKFRRRTSGSHSAHLAQKDPR